MKEEIIDNLKRVMLAFEGVGTFPKKEEDELKEAIEAGHKVVRDVNTMIMGLNNDLVQEMRDRFDETAKPQK